MASIQVSNNAENVVNVSKTAAKLLQRESVMVDLLGELMDARLSIDRSSIASGNILVTQGDTEKVAEIINNVFGEIDVRAVENDEEVLNVLNSLKETFPGQFETDFERSSSIFKSAFHRKIKNEVEPEITSLATRNGRLAVSVQHMNYLQCHLTHVQQEVQASWPESAVSITVQKEDKGQGSLLISSKRYDFESIKVFIENFAAKVQKFSKDVEPSRALFLSSTRGQKEVRRLEREHNCRVSVLLPGHRVLVQAESPRGHQLFLCDGNMAATDCNVLILPFNENRKEWAPTHHLILERGLHTTKIELYGKIIGGSPKARTLKLQSQRPDDQQTVVLLHVPDQPDCHSLVVEGLAEGLAEAVRLSCARGTDIALPVAMSVQQSLDDNLKTVVCVVQDRLDEEKNVTTVVLYLEKSSSAVRQQLVETLEKAVCGRWKTETDLDAVYGEKDSVSPTLAIVGQAQDVEITFSKLQSISVPKYFQERSSLLNINPKSQQTERPHVITKLGSDFNQFRENQEPLQNLATDQVHGEFQWQLPVCRDTIATRSDIPETWYQQGEKYKEKDEEKKEEKQLLRTVEVSVGDNIQMEDTYTFYFEAKRHGGGEVEKVEIDREKGIVRVTFVKPEVAARVAGQEHKIAGQPVEVTLYVPPVPRPPYPDKLLFHNVAESTTRDCLSMYLERITGQEPTDLIYADEVGDVLAVFDEDPDFSKVQEMCRQKKLEGRRISVSKVPISNCMLVENLSRKTTEDTLLFYFEGKRNGGGPVEKVTIDHENSRCLVFFENYKVIENILRKPHTLDESKLQVRQYFECLGLSGGRRNPNTSTLPKTLEFFDLDKYKTFFIQQSTTLHERLVQQLTALYAKPMFSDRKLSVECTLRSSVEDVQVLASTWTSDVQRAVNSIFNMIVVLRQEVTQEMWDETKNAVASIKPAIEESAVIVTEEKAFIVVGVKMMADSLMKQVKQSITQKEEETKRRKLEFTETVRNLKPFQLRLLAAMSFQTEAAKQHPGLKVDICTKKGEISYHGVSRDVKEAQVQMYELLQSVKSEKLVNMSNLQKTLLACKETQEYVVQKFKARKTVAIWDLDLDGEVTVYSFSDICLANAIQVIKKSVVEHQRPLEPEAAELLTTPEWTQFNRKLIDSYPGLLKIEAFPYGHLYIAGTDDIMRAVVQNIELFLDENTLFTLTCHFSPSRQLFVAKYWQDKICAYSHSLSAHKVDVRLATSGQEFYIRGSQTGVKIMRKYLEKLGSQVKCHLEILTDPAKVMFLSSPRCEEHLEKIGCKVHCVFSLKEEPENLTVVQSMSSQRVISEVNREKKPDPETREDFSKGADKSHCNQEGKLFVYGEAEENIRAAIEHLEDLVCGMLKHTTHREHCDDRTQDMTEHKMRRSFSAMDITTEIASDVAATVKQTPKPLPKPRLERERRWTQCVVGRIQSHSSHGDQSEMRRSAMNIPREIASDVASAVKQKLKPLPKPRLENLKEIRLPSKWQPMNGDQVKLIDLPPGSVEYKQVMHFLAGQPVGQIQRVQNPALYQQYKVKEQEMKTHNSPSTENVKRLWYHHDFQNVDKIIANGFKHKYCRRHGTDYGQGVCFKTSLKTCKDWSWSPQAILAQVLVGEFTQGVPSMHKPPQKPNSSRHYDSLSGPDMFIIYHDDQAYPEYLVTFTNDQGDEDHDGVATY